MVYGEMSDIQVVTLGVPQGMVLAAMLFIIMMSDIDETVREYNGKVCG